MLVTVILFLTILFLPRLIILAADKVPFLNTLGSVFLCYFIGLLLSFAFKAGGANISLAADFSSVLVCIAMPLILFSADLPALKKLARPMLTSFAMNCVAAVAVAAAAFFLFKSIVPEAQNISAMLVGSYVGGTPNMIAIGKSLSASNSQILLLQTADMIGGGTYFLLLLSLMPWLTRKLLPKYKPVGIAKSSDMAAETQRYTEEFSGRKQSIRPFSAFLSRAGLVGLTLLCFAVGAGLCLLLPSKYGNTGLAKLSEYTVVIMLVVTTGGIALSFVKKIRSAPGSYSTGLYFILMFAVVMGLSFDVSAIGQVLVLLAMELVIQYGTVALHLLMARLGKIDSDTMTITSCAGIFGPPFIIPVAKALRNDEVILPGILCGILGLVIGNYAGIGVGNLLGLFT
ncbi:Uncharacterized membrane protein [Sporobacter termitidis DSM 10068]|uniref:Uncharacterized membrane protein n=1 Tax=Sporobacter termitidis DSM 10068 TaxID=1123282 RepID=A0A1M5YFR7_9FIRM|nr:DUF819 family protein [Sporobacter termitidis]SHI10749.1 Uncharacterized membrane protein [Sporobacter termitidis DSM 10068]